MKNILKFNILIIFAFAIIISGCKWIDPDLNVNPDSPTDVPMELMLPSIQAASGFQLGGNTSVRVTNIWMQYFDGVDRQSLTQGRFQINSADVNDLWTNSYSQAMMDCNRLIEKAVEQNSPHYAGIAKVMMALNLGVLTNLYGDMPYSEAFGGINAVLQPAFDSQESIYNSIDGLLAEAITDLGQTENSVTLNNDLIYDGDLDYWIKAAYALRARYAFYRGDNANATSYISNAFGPGETFRLEFSTGKNQNPLNQFMADRNDIRMSSTFVNMLSANNDPRLPFYVAEDGIRNYTGSNPGSENSLASAPGTYCASEDSPVVFSSYVEMKFIEAEINLGSAAGLAAWKEGVEASVKYVKGNLNAADSAWFTANIWNKVSVNLTDVITEKYKAMYATVISYDDYRRTGLPILPAVDEAILSTVPARFPYPQSEITYNSNCPKDVAITTGLWIFN